MIRRDQLYKCEHCGNIVEVVQGGGPAIRCCGQAMTLQVENVEDAAQEKHVPVVVEVDGGILVTVGGIAHPMTEAHAILWVEVIQGGTTQRRYLKADEEPKAFFPGLRGPVVARAYCNLHGNWKRG